MASRRLRDGDLQAGFDNLAYLLIPIALILLQKTKSTAALAAQGR
jgi:hypothetical protein